MRISLRFILPLAVALTAIAYAVVPLVDRLTLNWFVRDIEIRTKLITNATQEPLGALVRDPRAKQKIMRFFDHIIEDERVYAVGFCDAAGKLAYASRSPRKCVARRRAHWSGPTCCSIPTARCTYRPIR
jgi:hypothetical protein